MKKLLIATAVLAICAPFIASAAPNNRYIESDVRVAYNDLDLSRDAGLQTLYKRLKHAARIACGPQRGYQPVATKLLAEGRQCYKQALASAVAKVDNERLNEMHSG